MGWGEGTPTQELLYVADAAEGVLLVAKRLNGSVPVNIGSSHEIGIRDLLTTIAYATRFDREIVRYNQDQRPAPAQAGRATC